MTCAAPETKQGEAKQKWGENKVIVRSTHDSKGKQTDEAWREIDRQVFPSKGNHHADPCDRTCEAAGHDQLKGQGRSEDDGR